MSGPAVVTREIDAPSEAVWAVLRDGWLFAGWVVGASRIRSVDAEWPAPGSRIHHSVGVWPALIDDSTRAISADAGRELVLAARAWPAGEATVRLGITTLGERTLVRMTEDVTAGPVRIVPGTIRQLMLVPRNRESLRRLALLAEGRAGALSSNAHQGQRKS